ncbi:2Fe-2S iron-sulfur cluster-binding protein [Nitratifractor sp.]
MKLTIQRFQNGRSYDEAFDVASLKVTTLLAALYEIKAKLDPTLTFDAGCRSGICGACAVRVDGREVLACSHMPKEGERIEPLQYHPIQRDLKVDHSKALSTLRSVLPFMQKKESPGDSNQNFSLFTSHSSLPPLSPEEEARFRTQSDCILCDSCYSVCPVLAVTPDFLGPFALTRALRYLNDPRTAVEATEESPGDSDSTHSVLLDNIQKNGIWDCTLCGECTAVCPQHIDPKGDIVQLRSESVRAGHPDPSFAAQSFGTPDFGGGFGFDPNGSF